MMNQYVNGLAKLAATVVVYSLGSTFSGSSSSSPALSTNERPTIDPSQVALATSFFRHYNPKVKDETINRFMKVATAYQFTSDSSLFLDCIHQICLESKADHSQSNKSGAMGICQITPTTAFDFLHKCSEADRLKMKSLGATSMEWAIDGEYSYNDSTKRPYLGKKLRRNAIRWLKNENNSLVLWGCMMHEHLSNFDRQRAFLRYHLGVGGISQFKGSPSKHEYIVLMNRIRVKKRKGVN